MNTEGRGSFNVTLGRHVQEQKENFDICNNLNCYQISKMICYVTARHGTTRHDMTRCQQRQKNEETRYKILCYQANMILED